jgi:hypothetical protein
MALPHQVYGKNRSIQLQYILTNMHTCTVEGFRVLELAGATTETSISLSAGDAGVECMFVLFPMPCFVPFSSPLAIPSSRSEPPPFGSEPESLQVCDVAVTRMLYFFSTRWKD